MAAPLNRGYITPRDRDDSCSSAKAFGARLHGFGDHADSPCLVNGQGTRDGTVSQPLDPL